MTYRALSGGPHLGHGVVAGRPLGAIGPHSEGGHRPQVLHQVVPVHYHAPPAGVLPHVCAAAQGQGRTLGWFGSKWYAGWVGVISSTTWTVWRELN